IATSQDRLRDDDEHADRWTGDHVPDVLKADQIQDREEREIRQRGEGSVAGADPERIDIEPGQLLVDFRWRVGGRFEHEMTDDAGGVTIRRIEGECARSCSQGIAALLGPCTSCQGLARGFDLGLRETVSQGEVAIAVEKMLYCVAQLAGAV